jgi:hypothetical protein
MNAALPKINIFEKNNNSPLQLVKPVSQFISPRSISQISNLSKMLIDTKDAHDGGIPRIREILNKSGRKIIGD